MSVLGTVLLIQLLGLKIFLTPFGLNGQLAGFIMVVIGILITVHARIVLDSNWAHAAEYQIKSRHELITKGVYGYIRHPIYVGITIVVVGTQLVAESYLFIPAFVVMFTWSYIQGRREETLLKDHFGKSYQKYMDKTKMLIPFVI